MLFLYSILLFFALLLVFPVYAVKLRLVRKEKLHLAERLGFRLPKRPPGRPFIWIHAVSVGEILSLQSLVGELKARHPGWSVGVSTLTGTGFQMAREKMSAADLLFFVPLDFRWCVRRVFRRLGPDLLVLAESEFWPRLLGEAGRHAVPVLLINGRISTRSGARMKKLRLLFKAALRPVRKFLVQTERDRDRLAAAGIGREHIVVAGNLKCEVHLPALTPGEIALARSEIGVPEGVKVLLAGSIHPGEEEPLLRAFKTARDEGRPVRFVLAPRHPEKFQNLERDYGSLGLTFQRKTRLEPARGWDVLILDTFGELAHFYALADAAFIGGSLIRWGGQNLLEPAFYGRPIFFGPHMDNFASLAEAFVHDGGGRIVREPEELAEMFSFSDEKSLETMGRLARRTLESLSGATEKTLAAMEEEIGYERKMS